VRYTKLDHAPVSGDPKAPFVVRFSTPVVGRYVRISQLVALFLHLRRVHVFGRAIAMLD